MSWSEDAACAKRPSLKWTIDGSHKGRKHADERDLWKTQRETCHGCPVSAECKDDWVRWRRDNPHALDLEFRFGTTPTERSRLYGR